MSFSFARLPRELGEPHCSYACFSSESLFQTQTSRFSIPAINYTQAIGKRKRVSSKRT